MGNTIKHKWAVTYDFQPCGLCDQQRLRPACAYAQTDQSLLPSLKHSMTVKLLTKHNLEFLSLKEGWTGSSESTHVKIPHCWKSHVGDNAKGTSWHVCQSKTISIHHECKGGIKKISVPRITDWHHEACSVMTIGDREGRIFLSHPHTNNGFFSCLPLYTSFILKKSGKYFQNPKYADMRHYDLILTLQWRHGSMCSAKMSKPRSSLSQQEEITYSQKVEKVSHI